MANEAPLMVGETGPELFVPDAKAPPPGWLDRLLIRLLTRPAVLRALVGAMDEARQRLRSECIPYDPQWYLTLFDDVMSPVAEAEASTPSSASPEETAPPALPASGPATPSAPDRSGPSR